MVLGERICDSLLIHMGPSPLAVASVKIRVWLQGHKAFFMLSSAEYEIFSDDKYQNGNLLLIFLYSSAEKISCSAKLSRKTAILISNLLFDSR